METQNEFSAIQSAIYGVALSLDAFLVNGIPSGVLQPVVGIGFLQKTGGNLLRDVAGLEGLISGSDQPRARPVMTALKEKCRQFIDHVMGLSSFRTWPLDQMHAAVSQVPLLREECIRLIQELEACYRLPKPFYASRPAPAAAAVNDFLANLESSFTEEWNAASGAATVVNAGR